VYAWDKSTLVKVFQTPDGDHASLLTALHDHGNALYLITAVGWQADSSTAKLYRTYDGVTWEQVLAFPEPEGWALEVYNGDLYAGTREERGHGKVYKLVIPTPTP